MNCRRCHKRMIYSAGEGVCKRCEDEPTLADELVDVAVDIAVTAAITSLFDSSDDSSSSITDSLIGGDGDFGGGGASGDW